MQAVGVVCILAILTTVAAFEVSPITRVVDLLNSLQKTTEKDGKAEEDAYESFVCWGKSVIAQKTAMNVAGTSRADELVTFIAETRASMVNDRSNALTTEIGGLMNDLESAKSMRNKENADFLSAKAEMDAATTALGSASGILGTATAAHKTGVLMAVRSSLSSGVEALQEQQLNLQHAAQLGERFLDSADALFLRRLLTGDVPKVDFKKLNRKAGFKMAYKGRSFKIQNVLNKMKKTFEKNLKDATTKENTSKASYGKLKSSKEGLLTTAQDALANGNVATSKLDTALSSSKAEEARLRKEVAADVEFIKTTEAALVTKKAQWKARQVLRANEIKAFSQAINILANDDARDLFKKSGSSQEGLFFLQMEQQQVSIAAEHLRRAADVSGDSRLLAMAKAVGAPKSEKTKFAPIIAGINKMITTLKNEENSDLTTVENCEKVRMEDTRSAAVDSRSMDDSTDEMARLQGEMDELSKEVKELQAEKKSAIEELADATKQRNKENLEWVASAKDDTDAAATVDRAKNVLKNFYKNTFKKNLGLVQKHSAPVVTAGAAPPPPADTWEGDYGGKTAESGGIITMLTIVHEDILKDKVKASADEAESLAAYNKFKKSTEDEVKDLSAAIVKKNGSKSTRDTAKGQEKTARKDKGASLRATLKKISSINPNCEYFTANYQMRVKNRQTELDGLLMGRAALQGGVFTKPKDANREMKVGDAFLQRHA